MQTKASHQIGAGDATPKVVPGSERGAAQAILTLFDSQTASQGGTLRLVVAGRETVLRGRIAEALHHMMSLLAQGRDVSILPTDGDLKTQAAADLLNVSRQYLVRLLDRGDIPSFNVGKHRRVRVEDLMAYKAERDARRGAALDRLAALSQEADGYDDAPAR